MGNGLRDIMIQLNPKGALRAARKRQKTMGGYMKELGVEEPFEKKKKKKKDESSGGLRGFMDKFMSIKKANQP